MQGTSNASMRYPLSEIHFGKCKCTDKLWMNKGTAAVQLFAPANREAASAPGISVVIPAHNAEAS